MNKKILINNIRKIIKENMETEDNSMVTIKRGLIKLFDNVRYQYGLNLNDFANACTTILAKYITNNVNENQPKPTPKPSTPGLPTIAPGKPTTKPGPRRPLTPPKTAPQTRPKAKNNISESENNILNKIESRFKKLKNNVKK